MIPSRRHFELLARGKGLGLAERLLARLPRMSDLTELPPPPAEPKAPPIRRVPPGRPIRLRLATPSYRLEGAPLSLLDLAQALTAAGGFEIAVMAGGDGPLRAAFQGAGIRAELGLPMLGDIYDGEDFSGAAQGLAQRWSADGADLVLANTILAAPAVEAARLAGLPALWTIRETVEPSQAFRAFGGRVAARALACLRHPDHVVFVAEASRQPWSRLLGERARVVANALPPWRLVPSSARTETRARLGMAAEEVLVLAPGTICARKGQRDLIAAWLRLPEAARRLVRLVCLGDAEPAYLRRLLADARRLPEGTLWVVPAETDMARWYAAADVMALTSRSESAPRVALEAMAAGLPLVVSPAFGLSEGSGALIRSPGAPEPLAEALARLALSAPLRAEMGAQARARFEDVNDFAAMTRTYAALIRGAAFGKGSPSECAA